MGDIIQPTPNTLTPDQQKFIVAAIGLIPIEQIMRLVTLGDEALFTALEVFDVLDLSLEAVTEVKEIMQEIIAEAETVEAIDLEAYHNHEESSWVDKVKHEDHIDGHDEMPSH
jgi:DUF1009 family protein